MSDFIRTKCNIYPKDCGVSQHSPRTKRKEPSGNETIQQYVLRRLSELRVIAGYKHDDLKAAGILFNGRQTISLTSMLLIAIPMGAIVTMNGSIVEGPGECIEMIKKVALEKYGSLMQADKQLGQGNGYFWNNTNTKGRKTVELNSFKKACSLLGIDFVISYNGDEFIRL